MDVETKNEYEKWLNSLNRWEWLFASYLEDNSLGIEENPAPGSAEDRAPYVLVDRANAWGIIEVRDAADVFEAHPTIIDELLDDLYEELKEVIPDPPLLTDKQTTYYPWEAGWYPLFREQWDKYGYSHNAESVVTATFIEDHRYQINLADLIANHANEVDLGKFI